MVPTSVLLLILGITGYVWAQDEKLLNIQCDRIQCVSDDGSYVYRRVKVLAEKKFHLVSITKANWYKAMQYCTLHGMRFAAITCSNDQQELMEQLQKLASPLDNIWISATNMGEDQQFYWMSTGKRLSFTDWKSGLSHSKNQCVSLHKVGRTKTSYKWISQDCKNEHYFLCEYFT